MAKRNEAEIRAKLGEEKFNFMQRFNEIIQNPKKHLFENGKFNAEKLSALFNEFADLYLKGDLKGKIPDSKFPKISVQKLTNLPPGSKNSKNSGGNYNRQYNFVEINAESYSSKVNAILSAMIMKDLATVCHEYQHFKQNLYASGQIQDSKIPTAGLNQAEVEENNKTMMRLSPEQLEIAAEMLGENPEAIKNDFLFGDTKNRLIGLADITSSHSYQVGQKTARGSKVFTNGKEPLYAAYYFTRPYEIDARDTSIAHFDTFIQDFQTYSHGKSRHVSTALKAASSVQKVANWWDSHKQPKEAMENFMAEARAEFTPEKLIEFLSTDQFRSSKSGKELIVQEEKVMIVERSTIALLEGQPPEKQDAFIAKLEQSGKLPPKSISNIKEVLAEMNKNSNAPKISHVTPEECQEASPEQSIDQKTSGTQDYGRAHIERREHTEEREKTPDELALEEMQMGPRPHYDD